MASRAPRVPDAPPTLAMTTGWPRCFCSDGANGRKMLSVSPPAAHGTIILIGRSGYAACTVHEVASAAAISSFFIPSSSKGAAMIRRSNAYLNDRTQRRSMRSFHHPERKSLRAPVAALRDCIASAARDERERFLLRHVGRGRGVAHDAAQVLDQDLTVAHRVHAGFDAASLPQRRAVADREDFRMPKRFAASRRRARSRARRWRARRSAARDRRRPGSEQRELEILPRAPETATKPGSIAVTAIPGR